jgi:hypothetical protein
MRKAIAVQMVARRLGLRPTRLTGLTQRLADSGQVHISSGPPYADISPIEVARIMLAGLVDNGLAAAPETVRRFGGLGGRSSTLEAALAHAIARPQLLAPSRAGLELHTGDEPYAVFTISAPDGAITNVFGDMPGDESVDRIVTVSGAALRGISEEGFGCMSADEADALLGSVN